MSGLFGGGGKTAQARQPTIAAGFRPQTSVLGKAIALAYGQNRSAGNLMWYADFTAIAHTAPTNVDGGGGGGGKGGGDSTPNASPTYTYTVAIMMGLCEGPIDGFGKVWKGTSNYTSIDQLGFSPMLGSYSQGPWSYLTTNHPTEALAYRGIAGVVGAGIDLGDSPDLPQFSWEIAGRFRYNPNSGIVDANPKDVINDLLSNEHCGVVGFPALVALTQYSNFCVANGIFLSPILDSQEDAASIITRLTMLTLSEPVWHEGALTIVPRGDQTVTGNGVTFTPNLTPLYDLTDDDFLVEEGELPVTLERTDPADAYNQFTMECVDRANDYNIAPVEWKDQSAIDLYGLHPTPSVLRAHEVTQPSIGVKIATLLGQRGLYVRRKFKFRLPLTFCLLEAMDLLTLTDENLNLSAQLVRILEVVDGDEEDGSIAVTAEEVPVGAAAPAAYGSQSSQGAAPNYNVSPGVINAPLIFDAPGILSPAGYEVWAAISSTDTNWGGAQVYISTDDTTYSRIGQIFGRSRQGVLTAPFAAGSDPDTVNSCSVNLSMSSGSLASGDVSDADNFNTLCVVDSELIAYQDAILTGVNSYTLGTYLRRGVYNTIITAHNSGAPFARCDQALFRYPYPAEWIGKTIYLKFASFNRWGGALQDLDTVDAYTYVIQGPLGAPDDVAALSIEGKTLSWPAVTNENVAGYLIKFQPGSMNTSWGDAIPLHEGIITESPFELQVRPAGTNVIMLRAVDTSGKESLNSAIVVTDLGDSIVANVVETFDLKARGWIGELTDGTVDMDDNLAADGTTLMWQANDQTNMWSDDPATLMWHTALYAEMVYVDAVTINEALAGSRMTLASTIEGDPFKVEYRENSPKLMWSADDTTPMWSADDSTSMWDQPPWLPWPGEIIVRNSLYEFRVTTAQGPTQGYVSEFTLTVDAPDIGEQLGDVEISAGGTRLTLAKDYTVIKTVNLTLQADGGTARTLEVLDKDVALGPLVRCFDDSHAGAAARVDAIIQGY